MVVGLRTRFGSCQLSHLICTFNASRMLAAQGWHF
jgi:hypothetical protein